MFTVYILRSNKLDRFHTGFTTNLNLRLHVHENAEVRKFTAKADDWVLFLEITYESKAQGLAIEKHIQKMKSRVYLENLIKNPENHCKLRINRLTLSPKASPFISSSTELKSSRSTFFAMTPPFK